MFSLTKCIVRPCIVILILNVIYVSSDLVTGTENALIDYYAKDCDTTKKDYQTVDPEKLIIHWYNSRTQNKTTFHILKANDKLYHSPNFKVTDKVFFYVSDVVKSPRTWDSKYLSKNFLKLKNTHLLIIDSTLYTGYNEVDITASFNKALANCHIIGKYIGDFLHEATLDGVDRSNIHLFGLGLGAHICGHAARRFEKLAGKKLKRISGLDPLGGCFDKSKIEDVLSGADAEYVDTYHTNIGQFGTTKFLGHASFFPNGGGPIQPDCIHFPFLSSVCSHENVPVSMWIESALNPSKYKARKCNSWTEFKSGLCKGEVIQAGVESTYHKGHYYLKTKLPEQKQLTEKWLVDIEEVLLQQLLGL